MSLFGNQVQYGPYNNQINNQQNNLLLYNQNNVLNQAGNNMLYQNLLMNQNNPKVPLYLTANMNNNTNLNMLSRNASSDSNINFNKNSKTIDVNKELREKRHLSSSGILKPSKRNKRFDRVLKNGKKLKNIDINRDYDESPDDDISSNMSSASNTFKNKLNKSSNNNYTIKPLKNNFEENSISSSHKSNKSTNDINIDNKESIIKKAKTQFSVSKQNNFGINPQKYPNKQMENGVYTLSLTTIPEEINPQVATPDTNNGIPNFPQNFEENIKPQAFPPNLQEIMNQDDLYTSPQGKGFKFCSQLSKAGRTADRKEKTDQDTPLISISLSGIDGFNIFGVLDGHGNDGHFVSRFFKDYFINKMNSYVQNLLYSNPYITAEDIYISLKSNGYDYITNLFINADNEIKMQNSFDYYLSGTTCNLVFQFNNHLLDFNVGDSRSILVEDSGDLITQIVHPLSIDHKPDLPEELQRIQESGGTVQKLRDFNGNELGPLRVFKIGCPYPGLAMSRSLGDLQAKECGVISNPQIFEYEVNSNTKYFVVCSDGVWEFLTNENVKDIGTNFYKNNDVAGFCKELVNTSAKIWEQFESLRDDITAVAVFF